MVDPTPIRKSTTQDMIETLGSAHEIIKEHPEGYGLFVVTIGPSNEVELIAVTENLDDLQIAGAAAAVQFAQIAALQTWDDEE
jgi:hypothetical protein